jgi:hypothetical protein
MFNYERNVIPGLDFIMLYFMLLIDLIVTGRACPRRISTIRTEEAAILQLLQQEGLLTKEKSATTGGLR